MVAPRGDGNQVRSILVDERAAAFDDPDVRTLMAQAVKLAGASLKAGVGGIVFESTIAGSQQ